MANLFYLCLYMAPLTVRSLPNHMRGPAKRVGISRELGSIPLRQGSATFLLKKKKQIVNILRFASQTKCVSTVPIICPLQKWAVGWMSPVGCNVLTPNLRGQFQLITAVAFFRSEFFSSFSSFHYSRAWISILRVHDL